MSASNPSSPAKKPLNTEQGITIFDSYCSNLCAFHAIVKQCNTMTSNFNASDLLIRCKNGENPQLRAEHCMTNPFSSNLFSEKCLVFSQ